MSPTNIKLRLPLVELKFECEPAPLGATDAAVLRGAGSDSLAIGYKNKNESICLLQPPAATPAGVAASRSKVMIAHKVVATAAPLRFELHIHLVDVSGTNLDHGRCFNAFACSSPGASRSVAVGPSGPGGLPV